jgi:hypothetical protein
MKIQVNYLAVRNKETRDLLDVFVLTEDAIYDEVDVQYYPGLVTKDDVIEWAKLRGVKNIYTSVGHHLDRLDKGMSFTLQMEARYIPSLGNMEVKIEKTYVDLK